MPFQVKVPLGEYFDAAGFGAGFSGGFSDGGFTEEGFREDTFRDENFREAGLFADKLQGAEGLSEGAPEPEELRDRFDSLEDPLEDPREDPADIEAPPEILLEKARAEAAAILNEARAEGAEIVSSADAESMRITEAARREADAYYVKRDEKSKSEAASMFEKAKRDGDAKGRAEGLAAYEELIAEAGRLRDEAKEEYRRLLEGAEGDALELVLAIAKKVVGGEISADRSSLIYMIKDAFSHCANKGEVVIKVSPDDYDYICENRDALLSMAEGVDGLEIRRDLSLGAGDCYIETPFGGMDAGAETRLSKIEEAFYRVLTASGAGGAGGAYNGAGLRDEPDGLIAS